MRSPDEPEHRSDDPGRPAGFMPEGLDEAADSLGAAFSSEAELAPETNVRRPAASDALSLFPSEAVARPQPVDAVLDGESPHRRRRKRQYGRWPIRIGASAALAASIGVVAIVGIPHVRITRQPVIPQASNGAALRVRSDVPLATGTSGSLMALSAMVPENPVAQPPARSRAGAAVASSNAERQPTVADSLTPRRAREPLESSTLSMGPMTTALLEPDPPAAMLAAGWADTRGDAVPAATEAAAVPVPAIVATTAVQSVLSQYASAFSALDARGVKAIWPEADQEALARAFRALDRQDVELGNCAITVEADRAEASCNGVARYVPKVGSKRLRTRARTWTFQLQQDGPDWVIESIVTR